jgi:hypothetical protein
MRRLDYNRLYQLKGAAEGKRVWIVGNGPSLKKLDLSKLQGEIVIVCNMIMRDKLPFTPTYYCLEDKQMMWNFHDDIMAYHVPGMTKLFPRALDSYVLGDDALLVNFHYENPDWRFSTNFAEDVYWGSTVAYMMLQLAYYLGAESTIVIGMDCGGGHFVSEKDYYQGKKANPAKWDQVFKGYAIAKMVFEANDRLVYNATRGGSLETFTRVPYEELF